MSRAVAKGPSALPQRSPLREVVQPYEATPIFQHEYCDVRFWYPWHFHPEVEIKHVISGSGTRVVGDSVEAFSAGDLCLVGSNTPHCWTSLAVRNRWVRARFVQFDPALFNSLPVEGLLQRARLGLQVTKTGLGEATAELDRLFAARTETRQLGHLLTFLGILAEAGVTRRLGADLATPAPADEGRKLAGQVLAFIQANSSSALSEARVARQFDLSPSSFSRFFSRAFGQGFARFLAELRVAHASNLLLREDDDVAVIAKRCGFGTVASLNRHFRRVKQLAPSEYRKQARRANAGLRAGQHELVRCTGNALAVRQERA